MTPRTSDVVFTGGTALSAVVLLAFLVACDPNGGQGTDTGNALTVEFAVVGNTTAPTQRDLGALSSAQMILNKLEYYACDSDDEVDFDGRFVADLLTRTVLGTREVSYAAVCGVELEAEQEGGQPLGNTIEVTGTTPGGTPFSFATNMGFEIMLDAADPGGFPLVDGVITRIAVVFDLDAWFAGIDLDSGTVTDETILIHADDNPGLQTAIEAQILADGSIEAED